ncbi:MAG TPA: hypothetical protein GXX29_05315 [Firmicutes bacterium]|nr:hypothetical protein [Bacillota bacterium]
MYDLPWMHLRKYFLLQNHSFEKETMNPIYFSEIASRRAEAFGPAIGHDHVPTCHIFVLQGRIGTGAGEVFFDMDSKKHAISFHVADIAAKKAYHWIIANYALP